MAARDEALFSWIHLSDIHFGAGRGEEQWDRKTVLRKLQDDAVTLVGRHRRPDAVFITGDVGFSGKSTPEQYPEAESWLAELLEVLGLTSTDVYAVPGNHDVDVRADGNDARRLVTMIRCGEEAIDDALLDPGDRAHLACRMQAYLKFAGQLAPDTADLFWSKQVETSQLRLRLIGLNTALVARERDDKDHLRAGKMQLERALQEKQEGELVVVLSHHPTSGSWLQDEGDLAKRIQSDAHIHLYGHIHQPSSEAVRYGSGDEIVRVAAGAVHDSSGSISRYCYSLATIVKRRRSLALRVYHRDSDGGDFRVDVHNIPKKALSKEYAEHPLPKEISVLSETGPHRSMAPSAGPTLAEYLDAVQRTAGFISLPGSDDRRALDSVWVRLDLSDVDDPVGDDGVDEEAAKAKASSLQRSTIEMKKEVEDRGAIWRRIVTTLEASSLLDYAPRTLIVGAAGTGKSTLLQWLAMTAAKKRAKDADERLPIWVRNLPAPADVYRGGLLPEIARRALETVGCESGSSDAQAAIADAIAQNRAYVLIDGVDEASGLDHKHATAWLRRLGDRVVLASRPLLGDCPWRDVRRVALLGIPGAAAEHMVRMYFPGVDWIPDLLASLRALPDGQRWLETPVLLGLAAVLRSSGVELPRTAISLYGRAIDCLVNRDRMPLISRERVREQLHDLAARVLAPEQGARRVWFARSDLPDDCRDEMIQTGLFDEAPGSHLRFTHLSLGEYLAAGSEQFDMLGELERLGVRADDDIITANLEVLPMALALRAPEALSRALETARTGDLSDHRVLCVLLRAIGYGGPGVTAFCQRETRQVVQLVATRLKHASGRFGNLERELMDAAARAFVVLREFVVPSEVEAAFRTSLDLPGEAGTEAHIAMCALGARRPERWISHWWSTIHRQAKELVRADLTVNDVRRLTRGGSAYGQIIALRALGKNERNWPRLRPYLAHPDAQVRSYAAQVLAGDHHSELFFRELLLDDDPHVRRIAMGALASTPAVGCRHLDKLRGILASDPNHGVRAEAIGLLGDDADAIPLVRKELARVAELPCRYSGGFLELRHAVFRRLADDDPSAPVIKRYLESRKKEPWEENEVLRALSRKPNWRSVLLARLRASDVEPCEILAFEDDSDALPMVQALLASARPAIISAAVTVMASRGGSSDQLVPLLSHPDPAVRASTIAAVASDPSTWPLLRPMLSSDHEDIRIAAVEALRDDAEALDGIAGLLGDPAHNVRHRTLGALARSAVGAMAVRDYFTRTRNAPTNEWPFTVAHDILRAHALNRLAARGDAQDLLREALNDPHERVRAEAIGCLAHVQTDRKDLIPFIDDKEHMVREAALEALADEPAVEHRLLQMLVEDQRPLRTACFRYFVDFDGPRGELRQLLASRDSTGAERSTVLEPLMQVPECRDEIVGCVLDEDGQVQRLALTMLAGDGEARRRVRDRARDGSWLRMLSYCSGHPLQDMLANDPEARPILREHLRGENRELQRIAAPLLSQDTEAWPDIRALLRDDNMFAAAIGGLGRDPLARSELVGALRSDNSHIRRTAATALQDVPEVRDEFISLLNDSDDGVRGIAIRTLGTNPSEVARRALVGRLAVETKDELRHSILVAVQSDPNAVEILRTHLSGDYSRDVRMESATMLSPTPARWAVPVESIPAIYAACRVARESVPDSSLLRRLRDFIAAPSTCDIEGDPVFGEAVLGWCFARMVWASRDGTMGEGGVFGEVEHAVESLAASDTLVRVAMDASECPVQRWLRPTHNLIEAWRVAKNLTSSRPPSLVLACADVQFEHLQVPPLVPGEVSWGPTFFGFRLRGTGR